MFDRRFSSNMGPSLFVCTVPVPNTIDLVQLNERLISILSKEERERMHRFHRPHDAVVYGVAHTLCRTMLTQHINADFAPNAWQFATGPFGKPYVRNAVSVDFSISHTVGMAACAVTSQGQVGVDIENLERVGKFLDIAQSHFTPEECNYLRRYQGSEQIRAFFTIWTLKEAIVKATGKGLSQLLTDLSVDPEALSLKFKNSDERQSDWSITTFEVKNTHIGALATKSAGSPSTERNSLPIAELLQAATAGN